MLCCMPRYKPVHRDPMLLPVVLAEQIQQKAFEYGTHVPLGETINPAAVRKGVKGLVTGPGNFYWNIQK